MAQLALQNLSPGLAKLSSGKHLSARLGRRRGGSLARNEVIGASEAVGDRVLLKFLGSATHLRPCSSATHLARALKGVPHRPLKAPPSSTLHPPARTTAPIHTNSTPHDRLASLFTLPLAAAAPLPSGRRRHRGRHTPLCSTAGEDKMIFATALVALGLAVGGGTAGQQALHTASRQNLI